MMTGFTADSPAAQTAQSSSPDLRSMAAVMMAEFVFDKPQMTWILYLAMIVSAGLLWGLLAVAKKGNAALPAGLFCLNTVMLLLLHALGSWEQDTLLLYAMMALSLCSIGTIVAVNLPQKN